MRRDKVLRKLRESLPELRRRFAVRSLKVFGSRELEALLGTEVDLVTPDAIKRKMRDRILGEAISD